MTHFFSRPALVLAAIALAACHAPPTKKTCNEACVSGATCDSSTGTCVIMDAGIGPPSTGQVGATCTSEVDGGPGNCTDGMDPICLTATDDYPNGYCSGTCSVDSDCGHGGVCVTELLPMDGGYQSGCQRGCNSATDCQPGYLCSNTYGMNLCLPNDCRFVPSICGANQGCDQWTGMCESQTTGYPAAFPAPVQVANSGGPTLSAPAVVAIFFNNDDMTLVPDLENFYKTIGMSDYWAAAMEYNVGPITATSVILNEAAPTTIDDSFNCSNTGCTPSALQQWLSSEVSSGSLPAATSQTIYAINYPNGTTITENGSTSCNSFGGYHGETQVGTTEVAYAVVPRCPGGFGFTVEQNLTSAASHELLEASTDPFPDSAPAYSDVDSDHEYFTEANGGGELGDMCQNDPEAYIGLPSYTYVVQRFWSNRAVAAGHDPCAPEYPGEVFMNGIPTLTQSIAFNLGGGGQGAVLGAKIAIGATGTIPIHLYSDYPTSQPWTVQVIDGNSFLTGGTPLLNITQSAMTGSNGDTITATITPATAGNPRTNHMVASTELFAIMSCTGSCNDPSSYVHFWWGIVGN